jgi:hypothetical protein
LKQFYIDILSNLIDVSIKYHSEEGHVESDLDGMILRRFKILTSKTDKSQEQRDF